MTVNLVFFWIFIGLVIQIQALKTLKLFMFVAKKN